MENTMIKTYLDLYKILSKKYKFHFFLLILFSIFSSFVELLSLGSVLPFFLILQDPDKIIQSNFYIEYISKYNFSLDFIILFFLFLFLFLIAISTVFKIFYLKLNCHTSYGIITYINNILFKNILNKDYNSFQKLSSKDVVTTIILRSQSVGESNFFIINIIGSIIICLFIIFGIFLISSYKIFILLFLLGLLYLVFWIFIRKKIIIHGKILSNTYEKIIKNTTEAMQMYPEIILYRLNNFFFDEFSTNNTLLRQSQSRATYISSYPGLLIQSFIISSLILIFFFFYKIGILKDNISSLVLIIIFLQRLIPNVQNIFLNFSNLLYHKENLYKTLHLLHSEKILKNYKNINFEDRLFNNLTIKNLSYFTKDLSNNFLLKDINFKIERGDKIALVGPSGSGKTTFLKIIMGFLKPSAGEILVNNQSLKETLNLWQSKISYVSQKIFLLDSDIYSNIALKKNITTSEKYKIDSIIKKLKLNEELLLNKDILNSVQENGKILSGGQIQRIAIARSIFQNREFMILDETFSELDNDNAISIVTMLKEYSYLSILLVTHNTHIASIFDMVYELKNKNFYEFKISTK
jgi:ABC-type multidrug transport system fused ATPase/permease subunit